MLKLLPKKQPEKPLGICPEEFKRFLKSQAIMHRQGDGCLYFPETKENSQMIRDMGGRPLVSLRGLWGRWFKVEGVS